MAVSPTISGVQVGQTTTNESVIAPFSNVTITDPNGGTDTLTIALVGLGGTLTGNGLTSGGTGIYVLSGTASDLSAKLNALQFKPNAGTPNGTATTRFLLIDQSAIGGSAVNASTTVIDSTAAVVPTILGTKSGQRSNAEAPVRVFSSVTIQDPNAKATETLTITLSGAGGTLVDGSGFSGLSSSTPGTYTLTGTASAVTSELQSLIFTSAVGAPNQSLDTVFSLTDASSAGTVSATDTKTDVLNFDFVKAPSISGAVNGQTTNAEASIKPFATVTITDPNVNSTDKVTITVSGVGGTLSGTGLSGGTGGVYTLNTDTAANVTAALQALTFTPVAGANGAPATTTFQIVDITSVGPGSVDNTTSVIDNPTVTTGPTGQATNPNLPVVSFDHGVTLVKPKVFTFTGTVSDPISTVSNVEVFADGVSLGNATLNGDGTWTLAKARLKTGLHTFTAIATDATGAVSPATSATFSLRTNIDSTPYSSTEFDYGPQGEGEIYTYADGSTYLATQVVDLPIGDHKVYNYTGSFFDSQDYFFSEDRYSGDYSLLKSEILYNDDNTHTITGFKGGLTLDSLHNDTLTAGGGRTTFVFSSHFGNDTVTNFKVGGDNHDILSLSSNNFADIADILRNTTTVGHDAVIQVANNESITLLNVTKAELKANQQDFKLHA